MSEAKAGLQISF